MQCLSVALTLMLFAAPGLGRSLTSATSGAEANETGPHSCMYRWLQVLPTTPKVADINRVEQIFQFYVQSVDELNVDSTNLQSISAAIGDDARARVFVECLSGRLEVCRQSRPCNAGKCLFVTSPSTHRGSYQCQCDSGYTGQFCDTELPSCSGNPCQNGGTCNATATSYQCKCPPLHTGRHCERKWLGEKEFNHLSETVLRVSQDVELLKEETRNTSSQGLTRIEQFLRRLEQRVETSLNSSLSEIKSQIQSNQRNVMANLTSLNGKARAFQQFRNRFPCVRETNRIPSGVIATGSGIQRFTAYCDRETDGGGWIVFQRRQDGSVNFYRDWSDYKQGFGSASGEFWLGLDNLHSLTSQADSRYELRIDIVFSTTGEKDYAKYSNFRVGNETSNYQLHVSRFSSPTLQDRMAYHNGQQFSTKDRDHDKGVVHCAQYYKGGWWYNLCHWVNVNGEYGRANGDTVGTVWLHNGVRRSLSFVEMKLRKAI